MIHAPKSQALSLPLLFRGDLTAGDTELRSGIARLEEGDLDGAALHLHAAAREMPYDAGTRLRLAGVLYRSREVAEAREEVRAAWRTA